MPESCASRFLFGNLTFFNLLVVPFASFVARYSDSDPTVFRISGERLQYASTEKTKHVKAFYSRISMIPLEIQYRR